jgi:hypothetical protein
MNCTIKVTSFLLFVSTTTVAVWDRSEDGSKEEIANRGTEWGGPVQVGTFMEAIIDFGRY